MHSHIFLINLTNTHFFILLFIYKFKYILFRVYIHIQHTSLIYYYYYLLKTHRVIRKDIFLHQECNILHTYVMMCYFLYDY